MKSKLLVYCRALSLCKTDIELSIICIELERSVADELSAYSMYDLSNQSSRNNTGTTSTYIYVII